MSNGTVIDCNSDSVQMEPNGPHSQGKRETLEFKSLRTSGLSSLTEHFTAVDTDGQRTGNVTVLATTLFMLSEFSQ